MSNYKDWLKSELKNIGFVSVLPEYYFKNEKSPNYNDVTNNSHVNFLYKIMMESAVINKMNFNLQIIEGEEIVSETLPIFDDDFYDKLSKFCYENTYK
jgi:hypothetical protein